MFAKLIPAVLVLFSSAHLFSQTNPDKGYLCFSYSFGITGRLEPDKSSYGNQNGAGATFEISNIPHGKTGFFVNCFTSNHLLSNYYSEAPIENSSVSSYGITAGARFFTNNKKIFFDMGSGFYKIGRFREMGGIGWTTFGFVQRENTFGLNIGIGARFPISGSNYIVLKGKFFNAFISQGHYKEISLNLGLEAGMNSESKSLDGTHKISAGIVAGNSGNTNSLIVDTYGTEITYEVSNNYSFIANYFHKSSDYYYYDYNSSTIKSGENKYEGGARKYFSDNNLKPFIECLAGLSISRFQNPYFSDETLIQNSLGLVLGTGAEIEFDEDFSGIIKGNISIYDNIDNTSGVFGGLKYKF